MQTKKQVDPSEVCIWVLQSQASGVGKDASKNASHKFMPSILLFNLSLLLKVDFF